MLQNGARLFSKVVVTPAVNKWLYSLKLGSLNEQFTLRKTKTLGEMIDMRTEAGGYRVGGRAWNTPGNKKEIQDVWALLQDWGANLFEGPPG